MKTILVTGSTGPQGRAAIKSLLDAVTGDPAGVSEPAFKVIAITRNAKSPAAQTLRQIGGERLELFQCNLDDKEALKAVFEEVKKKEEHIFGVFCVLSSVYPVKDTSSEERQGKVSEPSQFEAQCH
jgi:nucleoside-diphosphate-sugar epimerase